MLFSRAESFFVCVQSSWFVGEADVARLVLTARGVPCHVENEHFHVWQWLYANITGGFKVLVPRQHADEAAMILANKRVSPGDGSVAASWLCRHCGGTVDGDWEVCWYCTSHRDGTRAEAALKVVATENGEEVERETDPAQGHAIAVVLLLLLLVFWTTGGSVAAVLLAGAGMLIVRCLRKKEVLPTIERIPDELFEEELREGDVPTPAEQSARRRLNAGNRIADRALLAAYFSAQFPPLAILSISLLLRLDQRKTPCGPRQKRQLWLAWGFSLLGVGVLFLLVSAFAHMVLEQSGLPPDILSTWSFGGGANSGCH